MLIGFSGAQGQGKSTVIDALVDRYGYKKVANTTARTVLKELGMTLDEVNRSPAAKRAVQSLVFNRHCQYIDEVSCTQDIVLMERTFADIYGYTLLGLGVFNEYTQWLAEYRRQCESAQKKFAQVFYISGRVYTPAEDGVRSTNAEFARIVDDLILRTSIEFCTKDTLHHIIDADHEVRVAKIHKIISILK